ncbi:MAG: hypothetical protein ABH859_06735 [Pseudomonadota bacterium]
MLKTSPTNNHLNRIYWELARAGAECVGAKQKWPYKEIADKEELIVLAAEMSRYDPRLFNILVGFLIENWSKLNPFKLRSYYTQLEWPQTLAVLAEFLKGNQTDNEAIFFAEYLQAGLKPISLQFYFINLYVPGGNLAKRALEEGLLEFKKWGFLACERPTIDLKTRKTAGLLDPASRRNLLCRLLGKKPEITLKEYLQALNYSISRQQALLDLKASGKVKSMGKGRSAKWKLVA